MRFENHLDVVIVDASGNDFTEWGKQKFGPNRLSCYIQSETGVSFGIKLKPTPHLLSKMDGRRADLKRYDRAMPRDQAPPPPAYDFLATLKLDGREAFEKRNIVYLDGENYWFRRPDGIVTMLGKNMRESMDSDVKLHKWVFQEVGIESMIQDLSLVYNSQAPELEDPLVRAMQDLGSNKLADKEETATAGVIEVTIERVEIAKQTSKREWSPDRSTLKPAPGCSKPDRNVSHTTSRDNGTAGRSNVHEIISYELIDPEDKPWAIFKFFYRSEDVLRKFDFAGFPQKRLKPDADAMAKLALDGGHFKRGTHELDVDSDSGDDTTARQAVSMKKVRKTKATAGGKSSSRAGLSSEDTDSEEEYFDHYELQEILEEDSRGRGVAKPIFIDVDKQPLAGPKRAVFSRDEQEALSSLLPTDTNEITDDLAVQEPGTATEFVQHTLEECDEEL